MPGTQAQSLPILQSRQDRLEQLTPSAIRAVHNEGERLRAAAASDDFIALHFGEGDLGTPAFIVEAGVEAMRGGALNYENNAGRPDLIAALVEHYRDLKNVRVTPERIVVACGGVQAIALTMLGLIAPGDDVINLTPAWPNFREAAVIAGAKVHELPLEFDQAEGVFRFDAEALERLAHGLERLRMIIAATPANPTGYVMTEAEKRDLLGFCRRRGITLLADEIYDRITYLDGFQPSFLHLEEPGDPLVVINGFSKTYAMTGWRLGYLIAQPDLAAGLSQMQEFATSCAPAMAQVAAITALKEGEAYVEESRLRYRGLRDLVLERLGAMPGITVARPDGAFYVFFQAPGSRDSLAFCNGLLREQHVILAPGKAFGMGGEGWLRLCYAKAPELLHEALNRLERYIVDSPGGE